MHLEILSSFDVFGQEGLQEAESEFVFGLRHAGFIIINQIDLSFVFLRISYLHLPAFLLTERLKDCARSLRLLRRHTHCLLFES